MIEGALLRAARGLLDWDQPQLAEAAGLSVPTIKRAERNLGVKVSADAYQKIATALATAGVVLVEENGDGPGVRLRKKRR